MRKETEEISPSPSFLPGPAHLVGAEGEGNGLREVLKRELEKKIQAEEEWRAELPQRLQEALKPRHGRSRSKREVREIRDHFSYLERRQLSALDDNIKTIIETSLSKATVPKSEKFSPEEYTRGARSFYLLVCEYRADEAINLLNKTEHLQKLWEYYFSRFILTQRIGGGLTPSKARKEIFRFSLQFDFPPEIKVYVERIAAKFNFSRNERH